MHLLRSVAATGLCALLAACPSGPRFPDNVDPEADQHLWSMGRALAGTDAYTAHVFVTSELGLDGGPVVEHAEEARVTLQRPAHLAVTRRGDLANRDSLFDGEMVHVVDLDRGAYASERIPEEHREIGAMLDYLMEKYDLALPLADFAFANPYDVLIENVQLGRFLGLHQVEDRTCAHLAFRQPGVDWQIWVEASSEPVPRKFVIKETGVEGEPEYCAEFTEWDLDATPADDAFTFVPPDNMTEIPLAELLGLEDEE